MRIDEFNVTVPDGCVIGVVGDDARLPYTNLDPIEILQRRQSGETLFVRGIDPRVCDEGWWIRPAGDLERGDPGEILAAYTRDRYRQIQMPAPFRRGDGRARLVSIETLDAAGQPSSSWRSGDEVQIRVAVEFANDVADPVVGIMIRTRIGTEVYGTNTELEKVSLGPVAAGDRRVVSFAFRCDLCPQEYTITAASHDPDGVWHDWMEDAVAFRVTDSRYTAGIANLRARVSCSLGTE